MQNSLSIRVHLHKYLDPKTNQCILILFVEYGQWKTHVRQESLIFAGGSIGTKVGAGFASAAMTGLLTFAGYVTSSSGVATQSQETLNMIINIYKFGPIIIALLAFVTLALYKLDKMYPDIMKELTEREARGEL